MENLSIRKDNALKAHSEANENGKKLLEDLFGEDVFKFDYKTIVSYEAACKRNGKEPRTDWGDMAKDEIAYIKLKEIVKAINDDPEFPRFADGERRYSPYARLYTKKEIDDMDDEQKSRVMLRGVLLGGYASSGAYAGLGYVISSYAPSDALANVGSRLCFKEKEHVTFSWFQHKELWADYLFKTE